VGATGEERRSLVAFFVGTSGFSYKGWKGPFYPEKIKNADMLGYYAEHLSAVEINNTFYRMPKKEVMRGWSEQVPASFRFIIKASRRITHFKRLNETEEPMGFLLDATAELEDRLGAILFQLPPNMACDLDRLSGFVRLIPGDVRAAIEFRHASWFTDAVYDILRASNIAICHADREVRDLPIVATADWGYLRLRLPDYDDPGLRDWHQVTTDNGWQDTFVFFKHEDEGAGPKMAGRFIDVVASS